MKLKWKSCLKIGVSIFLLYLCIYYWPQVSGWLSTFLKSASPLLVGALIGYVLNILMSAYERMFFPKIEKKIVRKIRRPLCLILAIVTLLGIVALVVGLILPQLISCFEMIFAVLPGFLLEMTEKIAKWDFVPPEMIAQLQSVDWQSRIGEIITFVTSGIGSVVDVVFKTITSVVSGVITAFLGMVFSLYLLMTKDRLKSQFHRTMLRYLPEKITGRIEHVVKVMDECFHRYIVGQCTEAVILGLLCTLGMNLLRLPYPTMIGALIAFTALIPIAGAYIGAAIGAFLILMVDPFQALTFLIFIVVLQQLEGNLIYPKVVGDSIGLPGIWVLAAVTIGGGVAGIMGMLLGVPLAATIYRLVREDVNKNTEQDTETEKKEADT